MRALALAFVFALVAASAVAQATDPFALYKAGDYQGAIRAGLAQNDEAGFGIAARAALAEETLGVSPCLACLKRAEDYARKAIAAGGKIPESYVYLAAALGYQARVMGTLSAGFRGLASEARDTLEKALRVKAEFSWALAALGSWNIEVVHTGGRVLGGLMFDASFDKGLAYFRRAVAADPANLVIHFQFALALASYDLDEQRTAVARELDAAAKGTPTSAYDTEIKRRAATLSSLLAKHEDETVLQLVHKYQGYP